MKLPEKSVIDSWENAPTIYRLMHENRWSKNIAKQWFTDFMRWLYTSHRSELENGKYFMMDNLHYLDDVWHAYILSTRDYFKMSRELFDVEYIHHNPENPFLASPMPDDVTAYQMNMLLEDWGEEYIDRVWNYGADMYDIVAAAETAKSEAENNEANT